MLFAGACNQGPAVPPPDLPAVGGQVSLLRFPRAGGSVSAYHPDSLGSPTWTSLPPLAPAPRIRRVLGTDLDERLAWAVDSGGSLVAVDLESRTVRKQSPGRFAVGGVGPDGSLFLADADNRVVHIVRRNPVPFHDLLPAPPRALFGAANDQLLAVTAGPEPTLITANAEQILNATPIASGPVAATFWGDLLAVAADTAIVFYETVGRRAVSSLPTRQSARGVAFSPSGHRLYVTGNDAAIVVYDRFALRQLTRITLATVPREIRVDASGRWMLARPAVGDSVWVVDLATNRLTGVVPGEWAADLPLVAGAATLVSRLRGDVVTWDLRKAPPTRIATLAGAAADLWLAAAWVPRERVSAAVAAAETATAVQDSALLAQSGASESDSTAIYLQVSSSQNPTWAASLAKSITEAGFPASVLDPGQPEEGYRVVVGPYSSRDAAEEGGRKLGRAYFILRLPAKYP